MGEQLAVSSGIPATGQIHPMPFTRIELVIMSIVDGGLAVLLGKRAGPPHKGKWALPGGVLRIDLDRDLESAAQRVAGERLDVTLPYLRQLLAVGSKNRDSRAPWALSVAYRALIPVEAIDPQAGKRLEAIRWCPIDEAREDPKPAFDHADLIRSAAEATRAEIERLELPFGFLPEAFTLGELQSCCEAILGRRLDKSSFRRRLDERELLEPVAGEMRTGAFRPAQLYRKR
jgi:ADP-ribose pyrophosphatase YjhB (NUDIX family)